MDPAHLAGIEGVAVEFNAPLAAHTRFGIGGPADFLVHASSDSAFIAAIDAIRATRIPLVIIGSGTNLVVADEGFRGAVLRLETTGFEISGTRVRADAGISLQAVVDNTVDAGLAGLETMTGIPGTLGAAIYGNAGAYGHSISERVSKVRFYDGLSICEIGGAECAFRYRESVFKHDKTRLILSAELEMDRGDAAALRATADKILDTRNRKYPPTMRCAGSIFKNFLYADLPAAVQAVVPKEAVIEGKVPSAWFLEKAGAKGMRIGDIQVATYHANLIYNDGNGTARDLVAVIHELKRRVRETWGIGIEEEVQYVGAV